LERSLKDIAPVSGAAKNRPVASLLTDLDNPDWVTPFLLGLGYEPEQVVNTLVERCSLTREEATKRVANHNQGGPQNHV
jgi:hypothetical protein